MIHIQYILHVYMSDSFQALYLSAYVKNNVVQVDNNWRPNAGSRHLMVGGVTNYSRCFAIPSCGSVLFGLPWAFYSHHIHRLESMVTVWPPKKSRRVMREALLLTLYELKSAYFLINGLVGAPFQIVLKNRSKFQIMLIEIQWWRVSGYLRILYWPFKRNGFFLFCLGHFV